MNIHEITIGSLVRTNKGKIIKVENISTKKQHRKLGYHDTMYEDHIKYVRIGQVEPIPLTQELLVLNGWEQGKYPMQEEFEHKDVYNCSILYIKIIEKEEDRGLEAWNINDDAYLVFNCKYVHELQQALWINGHNELADNFKVE